MKRIFSAAFVALCTIFVLVGCSKELPTSNVEQPDVLPQIQQEHMGFSVVSEQEVTGDELYASTLGVLESNPELKGIFEQQNVLKIKSAFQEADTKALSPVLYKVVKINYQTLDQFNKEVTASALIVYPLLRKMTKVMLVNHGTHIGNAMIPSQYTSVEAIMGATGALCILPDYIGIGASADHPDLYLNHEVHGRTSVDALLTLLDYAKSKKLNLASNYKTYIAGYSQGGSVSLASLRRVQQLDAATQKRINLQKVFCGDGPYDLRMTFESYLSDYKAGKEMGLPSVIPMVINSMFNSYPEEMSSLNYEDFFTDWALSTGVPQAARNNSESTDDMLKKFSGKQLGDILDMEYLDANPDAFNLLLSMMDRQNLCKGWTPKYSLKLLHCNPDGVVPYANFEEAYKGLNNSYMQEPHIIEVTGSIKEKSLLVHCYGMVVMLDDIFYGDFLK